MIKIKQIINTANLYTTQDSFPEYCSLNIILKKFTSFVEYRGGRRGKRQDVGQVIVKGAALAIDLISKFLGSWNNILILWP